LWYCGSSFPLTKRHGVCPFGFSPTYVEWALGGWLAGIIYDQLGSYGPAFLVGLAFNLANILLVGWMAARQHRRTAGSRTLDAV
jgi:hypothetical protein